MAQADIKIDGTTLALEGNSVVVKDGADRNALSFNTQFAILTVGVNGNEGDLRVVDGSGRTVFNFDGQQALLSLGARGSDGDLVVRDSNGAITIRLDGNTGNVTAAGGDCAEDFDVDDAARIAAGDLLVIDADGRLTPSTKPYDRAVAGVVSGAGDRRPGVILGRRDDGATRVPVALLGTAYCRVDAGFAPVEVGDLLTTSATRGHAMKALDPIRAVGSVIGKAMQPLAEGRGLVPVLVALG